MASKRMSNGHKQALATGREHSRAVKAYLVGLQEYRPRRGRQVTVESGTATLAGLEVAFVEHAKPYAEGKGITRAAFRELGVPSSVLTKAGVR